MSDPIMQKLDEMQIRCDAATEGPWEIYDDGWDISVCTASDGTPGIAYVAEKLRQGRDEGESDARFVAASRTDMPKLIAALRAVYEKLGIDDYCASCVHVDCETSRTIDEALGVDDA